MTLAIDGNLARQQVRSCLNEPADVRVHNGYELFTVAAHTHAAFRLRGLGQDDFKADDAAGDELPH